MIGNVKYGFTYLFSETTQVAPMCWFRAFPTLAIGMHALTADINTNYEFNIRYIQCSLFVCPESLQGSVTSAQQPLPLHEG
jgi:hypothetical protein